MMKKVLMKRLFATDVNEMDIMQINAMLKLMSMEKNFFDYIISIYIINN